MYINKVMLLGNLTRDPELRALPNGTKVSQLSLATNRSWKDISGQRQESVEYHNVVAFGKTAELITQYTKKGNSLFVEGRLQTRSWDDTASGQKKYRTEIIVESFQFGPRPAAVTGTGVYKAPEPKQATGTSAPAKKEVDNTEMEDIATIDYPNEDINAEDIPF